MLARLRLDFRNLREHKFRHSLKDTLNSLCFYIIDAEAATHYFLRCHSNKAI